MTEWNPGDACEIDIRGEWVPAKVKRVFHHVADVEYKPRANYDTSIVTTKPYTQIREVKS